MSHPGHPGAGHPPHGNPYSGGGGGPGGYYNNPNYGKMYDDYNTYCQQYYAQYYATQAQVRYLQCSVLFSNVKLSESYVYNYCM